MPVTAHPVQKECKHFGHIVRCPHGTHFGVKRLSRTTDVITINIEVCIDEVLGYGNYRTYLDRTNTLGTNSNFILQIGGINSILGIKTSGKDRKIVFFIWICHLFLMSLQRFLKRR